MTAAVFLFEAFIYSSYATKNLLSQFFDVSGYSPFQIGLLVSTIPLVSMISNPIWFMVGSKIGNRRVFSYLALFASLLVWPIFLDRGFLANMIMMSLMAFFLSSVIPVGEARLMSHIKQWGGRFDHIRLFGTIGFGTTALMTGILVRFSFFWLFLIMSLSLAFSLFFQEQKKHDTKKTDHPRKEQVRHRNGDLFTFWLMTSGMLLGMTLNSFHNSFVAVLSSERGFGVSTVGLVFTIAAFSEIPFLMYANKIIAILGNLRVLQIGMAIIAIRVLLVSFSTGPLSLLMFQMLHGMTYILVYYALFDYIHFMLPKKYLIFGQSVFWITRSGIAYILGSVLGGLVIESLSTIAAFRVAGVAGLLFALVIFVIGESRKRWLRMSSSNTTEGS